MQFSGVMHTHFCTDGGGIRSEIQSRCLLFGAAKGSVMPDPVSLVLSVEI